MATADVRYRRFRRLVVLIKTPHRGLKDPVRRVLLHADVSF